MAMRNASIISYFEVIWQVRGESSAICSHSLYFFTPNGRECNKTTNNQSVVVDINLFMKILSEV